MGVVTFAAYTLLKGIAGMLIAMIISMILAVAVYVVMLLAFKAVTVSELKRMIKRR